MQERTTLAEKLEKHSAPEPNTGCILWVGTTSWQGYGTLKLANGKIKKAHRLSYELFVGPIPFGMCICHQCDTPACINPKHLFLGTVKENVHDSIKKARHVSPNWKLRKSDKTIKSTENILTDYRSGLSQRALAEKYNCHQSSISRCLRRVNQ